METSLVELSCPPLGSENGEDRNMLRKDKVHSMDSVERASFH